MSRIGKQPIAIPAGVAVTIGADNVVTVKGPKGTLSQQVNPAITATVDGAVMTVTRASDDKDDRAMHGLYRSLIHNMVTGVTSGFTKELEIVGTGYRAAMNGSTLVINVGYSHPVEMVPPTGASY